MFESYDAIKARFSQFWRCFSPEAIYTNAPAAELLETRKAPAPAKLSTQIRNYPAPADRNIIINDLSLILHILWEEVNRQETKHFLEECYVIPETSEDTLLIAKELLELRQQSDELQSNQAMDAKNLPNLVAGYSPEKPVVVLGRIGHGKSTFLKYLRLVKAVEVLKKYLQIQFDFVHRPGDKSEVGDYCFEQVELQLLALDPPIDIMKDSFARSVLAYDINRFKETTEAKRYELGTPEYKDIEVEHIKSLQSNRHNYLSKVFRHLRKGRNYSIAIFFDNLDRRNDQIQEEAFLRASAMARDWGCLVFVCLRPSTFYLSREGGVLDSLAPKAITVPSPKVSAVLKRRFKFAKRIAGGESIPGNEERAAMLGAGLAMDLPRAARFLETCEYSFGKNKKLIALFEATCNGNIRRLLNSVETMLTSSHFNTKKILKKLDAKPDELYTIADHEALRALLLINSFHYDPRKSIFINLYDIHHADPMEHFSRLLGINFLIRASQEGSRRGYCSVEDVSNYLCQMGYSDVHAMETVKALHGKKCLEARIPDEDEKKIALEEVRVTDLGRYTATNLAKTFEYLDAVVVDTPITSDRARSKIKDDLSILHRVERAKVFLQYLNDCSESLQDADASRLWSDIHTALQASIRGVYERASQPRKDEDD
ncbi:hypothetical protein [Paludisphaera sp.]|uniref:hypothetical protein n=1 Tax=Paludisphaera sp. TaxID=2017432 RepID=UPI00301E5513